MTRMTPRWRNAALIMAALGFIAIAIKLITKQYVPIDPCRKLAAGFEICFAEVKLDPGPVLLSAALNAAIWFGVVYLVFIVSVLARRLLGSGDAPQADK